MYLKSPWELCTSGRLLVFIQGTEGAIAGAKYDSGAVAAFRDAWERSRRGGFGLAKAMETFQSRFAKFFSPGSPGAQKVYVE